MEVDRAVKENVRSFSRSKNMHGLEDIPSKAIARPLNRCLCVCVCVCFLFAQHGGLLLMWTKPLIAAGEFSDKFALVQIAAVNISAVWWINLVSYPTCWPDEDVMRWCSLDAYYPCQRRYRVGFSAVHFSFVYPHNISKTSPPRIAKLATEISGVTLVSKVRVPSKISDLVYL